MNPRLPQHPPLLPLSTAVTPVPASAPFSSPTRTSLVPSSWEPLQAHSLKGKLVPTQLARPSCWPHCPHPLHPLSQSPAPLLLPQKAVGPQGHALALAVSLPVRPTWAPECSHLCPSLSSPTFISHLSICPPVHIPFGLPARDLVGTYACQALFKGTTVPGEESRSLKPLVQVCGSSCPPQEGLLWSLTLS